MSEAAVGPSGNAAHSGLQLAQARQSCNLSIADVAHQLKLSPAQVEAMEAGEYQRLPGAVFVRGFIRNYARLVKLDPEPLVAQAEQRLPVPLPAAPAPAPPADIPFPSGRELRWHKYAIGALSIVAALVTFEFYSSWTQTPSESSKSDSIVLPQSAGEGAAAPPASSATQVAGVNEAEPKSPPAAATLQADPKASTAATEQGAERKPGERRVRLAFDKDSWVEIRDRSGRRIFSQLNRAGTTQTVSGLPPLTLVVGNAAGVQLTYDDAPVNLAPHITVDVARLTLP